MKILHTDKDETPAVEMPAEQFIQQIQQPTSAQNAVIDLSTGQQAAPAVIEKKKNNKAIWAIIILIVLLIIAGLVYYFKLKAQKENGQHS